MYAIRSYYVLFLVNKYIEWSAEIGRGIYPGSQVLEQRAQGEIIFFGLYYITLGLHGLHVLIGTVVLGVMAVKIARGTIHRDRFVMLENSGLYWHLVDLVWIVITSYSIHYTKLYEENAGSPRHLLRFHRGRPA